MTIVSYKAYENMVKIIDNMDDDNRTLIMPCDFKGIDLHEIKEFQRFKFRANNSNLWEFEHPLKEYSFELGYYYSSCFLHDIVPDDRLHEILKALLVDIGLRNFVSLFPCHVHYFDHKDYQGVAEFLFQLIRDNKHDNLVCDTIRFFISEMLVGECLIKWQDIPEDVRCIIDNIDYEEVTAEEIEYWGVEFTDW